MLLKMVGEFRLFFLVDISPGFHENLAKGDRQALAFL
jgi:hypothetical protein